MKKSLCILGTRGVPANHGGFETFAEQLSVYLVNNGWAVTVYCQLNGEGKIHHDDWKGVRRVNIPIKNKGAIGTIIFDCISTLHAAKGNSLILTLGYNTAIFSTLYRISNNINIINMDGIEWKRDKWSLLQKVWFYLNERFACHIGNHLIADHPEIKNHLSTRISEKKITMIPYGADKIISADDKILNLYGLEPYSYAIVIARPEPENSIFEIVSAFSHKTRNKKLVVLGDFDKGNKSYCNKVKEAASNEVIFPGAIYDKCTVQALRFYALLYIHGHQVGGTNPSLVESLGAKNPVLAHDNKYNRWVAGKANKYFINVMDCDSLLTELLDNKNLLSLMSQSSKKQHKDLFSYESILENYENVLIRYI